MGLSLRRSSITAYLVLQAKSEVADLREVMDGWHHHCQVS